jgi:GTP diphosphokinase / guanosine-3',5'-bis(diphosphate) 3'-diphosphatase
MINASPTIKKALYFAAEMHDGQYRKGGKVPFIVHPVLVAMCLSEYMHEEDIIAAALLHDTVEDCDVSIDDLKEEFNDSIAKLVVEVSLFKEEGVADWIVDKKNYLNKIRNASDSALTIVACDKMLNMKGYFDALKAGNEATRLFRGSPDQYRWYYTEIGNILTESLGNHPIVREYHSILRSSI